MDVKVTIKKAECQRIDAFKLWCWRRLLRVPWIARSNQSILKEISPEYSLEDWCWNWNSNTLVTWCKELTHCKRSWCWARLKAWGNGDDRGWDGWRASLTRWTWVWSSSGSWWSTGSPGMLHSIGLQRVTHDWATVLYIYFPRIKSPTLILTQVWKKTPERKPNFVNPLHVWVSEGPRGRPAGSQVSLTVGLIWWKSLRTGLLGASYFPLGALRTWVLSLWLVGRARVKWNKWAFAPGIKFKG